MFLITRSFQALVDAHDVKTAQLIKTLAAFY